MFIVHIIVCCQADLCNSIVHFWLVCNNSNLECYYRNEPDCSAMFYYIRWCYKLASFLTIKGLPFVIIVHYWSVSDLVITTDIVVIEVSYQYRSLSSILLFYFIAIVIIVNLSKFITEKNSLLFESTQFKLVPPMRTPMRIQLLQL